jgi:hypothetical protein
MSGFFTIIAVSFVLALGRRYMSAASVKPPEPHVVMADLDNRFKNTQWIVGISMVVVGVLFAISTHAALVLLNRYFSTSEGPAEFRVWQQGATWWILPGFGAVALSWEIVLQLWSDFGNREAAHLYNYWSIQKSGFDGPRLLRWLAVLVVLPIGVLTILALPMHAALLQDDIHDCGYAFARCKVYRYADARRITMIGGSKDREGKLTRRAGIVIDFSDGRRWSSADIGDFSEKVDPAFAEFLQKKTKLPLNLAQTEADIPQLSPKLSSEKQ